MVSKYTKCAHSDIDAAALQGGTRIGNYYRTQVSPRHRTGNQA